MTLLQDFVDCDERLECLDLIGEDWLSVVPSALSTCLGLGGAQLALSRGQPTLSCPAKSSANSCGPMCIQCMLAHACLRHGKLLSRHLCLSGDVRLGETSSMLVALRMLMASSDSCLGECEYTQTTARPMRPHSWICP
jgi:hypothetical protein